jgi:methylenetetrahydrofolate dehydrogenase (NADP+)/methenyltetrahydrofolate cyclohydrolase
MSSVGGSLCNLCVLCVSVVVFLNKVNHRDTENTEVAQRNSNQDTINLCILSTPRKGIGNTKARTMMIENIETGSRARLLEGASLAARIKQGVQAEIARMSIRPGLAAVRVGDDPASAVYVRNKILACEEVGIRSEHHALPETTTTAELLNLIASLNARDDVDGILTQLPLPAGIDETAIIEAIDPAKDVDGFHPITVGKLALGRPVFVPATPAGIIELLDDNGIQISGANACVVGRSQIVGRPMAQLLLQRDATVTICHSRTRDLAAVTRTADLLVVAIGRPGFIGREHIKPGATVIDVGMNRVSDVDEVRALFGSDAEKRLQVVAKRGATLVGDVNPSEAAEVAGLLTPVPGGVGLLTVAMLMKNTLKAAQLRRKL